MEEDVDKQVEGENTRGYSKLFVCQECGNAGHARYDRQGVLLETDGNIEE